MPAQDLSSRRRPGGTVGSRAVAAGLVALQEAFGTREPVRIVEEHDASGEPADPMVLYLHPDIPEASLVLVRTAP